MTTKDLLLQTRAARDGLRSADAQRRNAMLLAMADRLQEHRTDILRGNAADMEAARGHLSEGMLDRLLLNNDRIDAMAAGIRALTALPEAYRLPLVLHYLEGMDYAQTARALGITQNAVRGRLSRGRAALKKWFEEAEE